MLGACHRASPLSATAVSCAWQTGYRTPGWLNKAEPHLGWMPARIPLLAIATSSRAWQTGCRTGWLQEAEPRLEGMPVRIPSLGSCLLVRLLPGSLFLLLASHVCQQTPQLQTLALHFAVQSLHARQAISGAGLGHLQAWADVPGAKHG